MTDWLQTPTSLYSSMYADNNLYQSQGLYKWAADGSGSALPVDVDFYRDIFRNGSVAQMKMFEQDFFCTYAWNTNITTRDVHTGADWLRAMDTAAVEAGISLQLCMMTPLHALAMTSMLAVSNGRGSLDNMHSDGSYMYSNGLNAMLIGGLGMFNSRDNVYTNPGPQVGCSWSNCTSPDYQLQNAAAMLFGGPYGPSDGVDYLNASMIARSCRPDGVLLRADRTLATSDAALLDPDTFAAHNDPQLVWATLSEPAASTGLRWLYVLSLSVNREMPAPLALLGATPNTNYVAWQPLEAADAGGAPAFLVLPAGGALTVPVSPPPPPPAGPPGAYVGGTFHALAPVLPSGWALLGETLKLVPASSRRFASVLGPAGSGLSATVRAANGECVSLWLVSPAQQVVAAACPAGACDGEDCDVLLGLRCVDTTCTCTLI
jgi:hypothetical protein